MEKKNFSLHSHIDTLSSDILTGLKEIFTTLNYADKTEFCSQNCQCRIDTYEIYSVLERGYITVNIYLFQEAGSDTLTAKVSVLSPAGGSSRKCRKIMQEIEKIIT